MQSPQCHNHMACMQQCMPERGAHDNAHFQFQRGRRGGTSLKCGNYYSLRAVRFKTMASSPANFLIIEPSLMDVMKLYVSTYRCHLLPMDDENSEDVQLLFPSLGSGGKHMSFSNVAKILYDSLVNRAGIKVPRSFSCRYIRRSYCTFARAKNLSGTELLALANFLCHSKDVADREYATGREAACAPFIPVMEAMNVLAREQQD